MLYILLIGTLIAICLQKNTRIIRIYIEHIINRNNHGISKIGCCDHLDTNPDYCKSCYVLTKLDFGSSIINKIIHNTHTNSSVHSKLNFLFESFIQYNEKKNQRVYFSNKYPKGLDVFSQKEYIIDELFNYLNIFDMNMKCSPCYSMRNYIKFYGSVDIFTSSTHHKYRAFVIKINNMAHLKRQITDKEYCDSDDICYYSFGIHGNSEYLPFYIRNKEIFLFRKNQLFMNYYQIYDNNGGQLFENKLHKIILVAFAVDKANKNLSVIDLWFINNILLEPYLTSCIHNKKGVSENLEISFCIYFKGYGFTEKNLHCEVNYNDPVDKIRNKENQLVCADSNYGGENCNSDVSKCKSNPCGSKIKCIGTKSNFVCICPSGHITKICKKKLFFSNFHNFRCKNRYNCLKTCNRGWSGKQCDIRMCIRNRCKNNSTCYLDNNRQRCSCYNRQFFGQYCQFKCREPCVHGVCSIRNNEIACTCSKKYQGVICASPKIIKRKTYLFNSEFYAYLIFIVILFILMIFAMFYSQVNLFLYKFNSSESSKKLVGNIEFEDPQYKLYSRNFQGYEILEDARYLSVHCVESEGPNNSHGAQSNFYENFQERSIENSKITFSTYEDIESFSKERPKGTSSKKIIFNNNSARLYDDSKSHTYYDSIYTESLETDSQGKKIDY